MLRERAFLGGQAVSMIGDGLAILAIPLLVMQLTRSPVVAVLASLPGSVGFLAAGLPAGVLADRANPWHVLITGDVIRAVIFLALFVLTGSHATALAITVRDVFTGPRLVAANSWLNRPARAG